MHKVIFTGNSFWDEQINQFRKKGISELDFDHSQLRTVFEKVIKDKDWRWVPGKEALCLVVTLATDFWVNIKKLMESEELQKITLTEDSFSKLVKKINENQN